MDIETAIKVLEIKKGLEELRVRDGKGDALTKEFIEAANIILEFINKTLQNFK